MAITIVKTGNGYNSSRYREIMVDSQADLADIDLTEVAPGSVAYTCESGGTAMNEMWMLSSDKQWTSL